MRDPAPLDPHVARFLAMASAGRPHGAPDLAARRLALSELARLGGEVHPEVAITDAAIEGPRGDIPIREYQPPDAPAAGPNIIYLHGGGWTCGGLDTHDSVCRTLAAASGFPLIAVDYRLAPENPYPAGLEDALAVLTACARKAGRLILAGDSAGATLAAAIAGRAALGSAPAIARLLLICPILDLGMDSGSHAEFADHFFVSRTAILQDAESYIGDRPIAQDPDVSPLRRIDLNGLPPTYIHVAQCDPFRDDGVAYAERLVVAGGEARLTVHPGMIHYFYALGRAIPYGRKAVAAMGEELRAAIG